MNRSITQSTFYSAAAAALIAVCVGAGGCSTEPRSDSDKAEIQTKSDAAVAAAERNDSTLRNMLNNAAGYAVFPTVAKGAAGVGGAYGKGTLHEGGAFVGYCDLSQASIGFALGGQAYTEIIAFETSTSLNKFKSGNFSFSAQATAVALKSGAGANAKYADGVAVFTMGETGLMYEASIGGQKFSYKPK